MRAPPKLKEDDFPRYLKTFKIWLIKKKKKNFDDLPKEKIQKKFKKFIKKWNAKDLNEIFYDEKALLQKYGSEIGNEYDPRDDEKAHMNAQAQLKKAHLVGESRMPFKHQEPRGPHKGPRLPSQNDQNEKEHEKQMAQHNLMLLHDVDANNTYKWGSFDVKREDRRAMQKMQQQQDLNQKMQIHQQKEDEKLQSILDTVKFTKKFTN